MKSKMHISVRSKNRTEHQVLLRIDLLQKALDNKDTDSISHDIYKSDVKCLNYSNKEIEKISLNAAKNSKNWNKLKALRKQLKQIAELNSENKSKKRPNETDRIHQLKLENNSLSSELMTLRAAYLDLLNYLSDSGRTDEIARNAVLRHKEVYGLYTIR